MSERETLNEDWGVGMSGAGGEGSATKRGQSQVRDPAMARQGLGMRSRGKGGKAAGPRTTELLPAPGKQFDESGAARRALGRESKVLWPVCFLLVSPCVWGPVAAARGRAPVPSGSPGRKGLRPGPSPAAGAGGSGQLSYPFCSFLGTPFLHTGPALISKVTFFLGSDLSSLALMEAIHFCPGPETGFQEPRAHFPAHFLTALVPPHSLPKCHSCHCALIHGWPSQMTET